MSTSNSKDTPAEGEEGEEKPEKAEEKDSVDGEKSAAINAIVCSFCDLPETETRNFSTTKCPCKSTWYCNTTCQKKHWKEHRTDCKRLIAELKRARKLQDAEEEKNRIVTGVNADTLPVKDEVNQNDDDGDKKSGTKEPKEKTNEKEEEEPL